MHQDCTPIMGEHSMKKITWTIKNFSSLQREKLCSDPFVVGRCEWRLCAYPKGNNVDYLFLFLEVADHESLPCGWRRNAGLGTSMLGPVHRQSNRLLSAYSSVLCHEQKWFGEESPRWGRVSMFPLNEIHAKESGYLVNGEFKIVAEIAVIAAIGKLDIAEETSTIIETMDVNGFQLFPSQMELVSRLLERHPEIASDIRTKNPNLRMGYMSLLLSLIETLRQSPHKLSKTDLAEADAALGSLTNAEFKLDWLEKKLDEMAEKKEKEEAGEARVREIEEDLKDLNQKCSDLEAQLEKQKLELSAAKAPISFDDNPGSGECYLTSHRSLDRRTIMEKQSRKKITWTIKNFSSLQCQKLCSDPFVVARCKWRLCTYPKGKNVDYLFLFLEVADHDSLPCGWRRNVRYSLSIINQNSVKRSRQNDEQKWFDEKTPRRGRVSMFPLNEIHAKESGYLVNGELKIVAEIEVIEVLGKFDVTEETSTITETMDVNGFQLLPSQMELVSRLLERHPDIASEFSTKNPNLRTGYMSLLLSIIETLRHSPHELSNTDLAEADAALGSMANAGFKLDWLENKLDEMAEKKEKEEGGEIRVREIEEELKDLKQKCLDLEVQLEKEKLELSAAKAPISFDDVM
ncbi:hypothetical protein YC2023_052169 [Brassica napus]